MYRLGAKHNSKTQIKKKNKRTLRKLQNIKWP